MKRIGKNRKDIVQTFAIGWVIISVVLVAAGAIADQIPAVITGIAGITGSITTYASMATSSTDEEREDKPE